MNQGELYIWQAVVIEEFGCLAKWQALSLGVVQLWGNGGAQSLGADEFGASWQPRERETAAG